MKIKNKIPLLSITNLVRQKLIMKSSCVCVSLAPRIELESPAYSVHEPESLDETSMLTVKVMRYGDKNKTLRARCSTRDGSAISGIDYNARSRLLTFAPGSFVSGYDALNYFRPADQISRLICKHYVFCTAPTFNFQFCNQNAKRLSLFLGTF